MKIGDIRKAIEDLPSDFEVFLCVDGEALDADTITVDSELGEVWLENIDARWVLERVNQ